jgi:hypothetical protein
MRFRKVGTIQGIKNFISSESDDFFTQKTRCLAKMDTPQRIHFCIILLTPRRINNLATLYLLGLKTNKYSHKICMHSMLNLHKH